MKQRVLLVMLLALVFSLPTISAATRNTLDLQRPTPSSRQVQPEATPPVVEPAIIGGNEAEPGEYPWVAAILRSSAANEKDGWYCGGALIRPGWVLTAAHCADDNLYRPLPPSSIDVLIGRHQLSNSDGERIDVAQVILHPNYNGATYDYDIALLRLSQESSYAPIDLVPEGDVLLSAPGVLSTIVGWGDTRESGVGSYADALREVQVPIVSTETCNAPASYNGDVTSRMLCAGLAEGGKDACQGDSGGPLMVPNPAGGWLQAGITSWGIGCADPHFYGVYTRISVFADWIQRQISDAASTATPTATPTTTTVGTTTPTATATSTPSAVTPQPSPTTTPPGERKMIGGLRIGNVRDSAFSVSWTTEAPRSSELYVAASPADLGNNPLVFSSPGSGQAHLVTATGLAARTTYYFYVRSGEDVDNNRGSYYRVTTGPTLTLPNTDNIRGFVEDQSAAPAADCVVFAEIVDSDPSGAEGTSALLATRSDANGFWTLDLGNARTQKLDAYFLYSAGGDKLNLEVQCAPDEGGGVTVNTNDDAPAPTIQTTPLQRFARPLDTGWNLVALPVQPVARFDADRLCAEMKQDAVTGHPVEIVEWRNGQWSGYICGVGANNFDLQTETAYFVRHNGPGMLDLSGLPLTSAGDKSTNLGWNGVNGISWGATDSSLLCEAVSASQIAEEVNRWFNAGWDGHICAEGFNNFPVRQGDGYFVRTKSAGAVANATAQGQPSSSLPQDALGVNEVVVANLSDSGVTISWWTDLPANGWVEVSRNGEIVAVVHDLRGEQTVDYLHYAQITGLMPETTYAFTLFSSYVEGGFAGQMGQFSTLPTPAVVPQSHSAYGQIVRAPNDSPASAMRLVLNLIPAGEDSVSNDNADNHPLPLTVLVGADGYWYVNLGNWRTSRGDPVTFSGEDLVEIVITQQGKPPIKDVLTVATTFPAPDIRLPAHVTFFPLMR